MLQAARSIDAEQVLVLLPEWLRTALAAVQAESGGELYLSGGVVRDLLRGQGPTDIDLTVAAGARTWAGRLATLTKGALVPLGRDEDAARVVSRGVIIDIASFREGARTIAEDLMRRDLTVNALACRLDPLLADPRPEAAPLPVLDPTGGGADLGLGLIRVTGAKSLSSDPLRLLRVFRFAALLGFAIEAETLAQVGRQGHLVQTVAPERIAHELDLIMGTNVAATTLEAMAASGLLWAVLPELAAGIGMAQPKSHHLDVWEHNLEALRQMERIVAAPEAFFPDCGEEMSAWLQCPRQRLRLKWAALCHDLGKPATMGLREDKGGRITFYNHDRVGARMFAELALRLRWSNEARDQVGRLVEGHMRPFHLANVARTGSLTLRAAIRMLRAAGDALEGLFLLAMADSLAGQGTERIEGMEEELVELYRHLRRIRAEHVAPVRSAPPLLTGRDLIDRLHLPPGPLFKRILAAVEEARMTGEVGDADGALRLAKTMAAQEGAVPEVPR
ncbi:MAG: HDIG domain-containing protein [Desulfobulbus sp.]|jgi:poly(A) polymerase|uniref:HD domain-containing protein n=1 Tax=Desulfobulbus sp. TaxID=895 RepID=UPI002844B8F3|nr:HD domain-containing protein [Desulfobulbus sp.]MDR2548846.1 HDIG domain-containing protein [Desulfobulbus sp.]